MQIRLLQYFVAVSSERHFGRAAESCHVSQPTLSAGLAALEEQLGRRLVERDRRFIGLTEAGAAVLPWAQQLLADFNGLTVASEMTRGALTGTLRLGTIPASVPSIGFLAEAIGRVHPRVELSIYSLTSREIERGLAAFDLDAGVTYLDHEPPARVIAAPLYSERAMFVAAESFPLEERAGIGWAEAIQHPLCLLHQGMQNRRILDGQLAARGLVARPRAIADSYVTLLAMARSGAFATIMPDSYVAHLPSWARMIPFTEPAQLSRVGLIVPDRSPLSPLSAAALTIARTLQLPDDFTPSS